MQKSSQQQNQGSGGVKCPQCQSVNLQTIVEGNTTGKGGFSAFDGCLGYLLLGPLGLLCGSKKTRIKTTNTTFFMCMDCGNKFKYDTWKKINKQEQDTSKRIAEHEQNVELFQTTGMANSKMVSLESAKKIGSTNEAVEGPPSNQANDRLVACGGGYIFYVVNVVKGSRLTSLYREEKSGRRDRIRIHSSDNYYAPKYLFADEERLYFMANEGNKSSQNYRIYSIAHNSTEINKITDAKVDQIYCYGDLIYYINGGDKCHIYSIKKDGTENLKLIAEKASHLIIYNDKIYFNSKKIKCADLDGGNVETVLDKKLWAAAFRISGNSLYYEEGGPFNRTIYRLDLTSNRSVSVLEMRDSVRNIAIVSNIINQYNIINGCIIGSQGDKDMHRWVRYDPDTRMTVKYEDVPFIAATGLVGRVTVNIVNGLIYFGDEYGVQGRMPIDGGSYKPI